MRAIVAVIAGALLIASGALHASTETDKDWQSFGRMLALVHSFVRVAASSPDPQAVNKGIDAILAGRNDEANRAAADLFQDMFGDMPPQTRGQVAAMAKDLATLARRENARAALEAPRGSVERALEARKDLHAMGLSYHDPQQFLAAVARGDALAVDLYIAGRGVNLGARDAQGRSALELARGAGNERIAAQLEAAGVN